jgi:hypothetical protein
MKKTLKNIKSTELKKKKTLIRNKIKGGSAFLKKTKDSLKRASKSAANVVRTGIKNVAGAPSNVARTLDMGAFYNFMPGNSEVKQNFGRSMTDLKVFQRDTITSKNLYVNLKANLMALACIDHLTFLEMMFNNANDISDYVNAYSHIGANSWIAPNVLNYRDIVDIQQQKFKMGGRETKRNKVVEMFKTKFKEKYTDYEPNGKGSNYIKTKRENKGVIPGKDDTKTERQIDTFITNFGNKIDKIQKYIEETKDTPTDQDTQSKANAVEKSKTA